MGTFAFSFLLSGSGIASGIGTKGSTGGRGVMYDAFIRLIMKEKQFDHKVQMLMVGEYVDDDDESVVGIPLL